MTKRNPQVYSCAVTANDQTLPVFSCTPLPNQPSPCKGRQPEPQPAQDTPLQIRYLKEREFQVLYNGDNGTQTFVTKAVSEAEALGIFVMEHLPKHLRRKVNAIPLREG